MIRDIGLKLNTETSTFDIVNQKDCDMGSELQSAITLLFLSPISDLRGSFDGIYSIVGSFNNNTQEDLKLELASISFNLTKSLKELYPYIDNTQFSVDINGSSINIDLTINTQNETMTTTIYSMNVSEAE
jgi:hypothetical protein